MRSVLMVQSPHKKRKTNTNARTPAHTQTHARTHTHTHTHHRPTHYQSNSKQSKLKTSKNMKTQTGEELAGTWLAFDALVFVPPRGGDGQDVARTQSA